MVVLISIRDVDHLAIGHLDAIWQGNSLLVSRASPPTALDTLELMIKFLDIFGLIKLLGLAESNLTHKHQEAFLLVVPSGGIGKTLIEHIREVYTLSEHVA